MYKRQIYDYIKDDIKKGRIQSGEKLPSTRALSAHLEVSRSTVELAYEQLLSEGYIEAQPYRGYFVCQIDGLFQIDAQENNKRENNEQREQKYRYDFTPSGVDPVSYTHLKRVKGYEICNTAGKTGICKSGRKRDRRD